MRFELGLCFVLGHFCNKIGRSLSNISLEIEWKSFSMTLNGLRDLQNEVKVTRFYLGLRLILVPLCTKFSETLSNSSLVIEQKPFQMTK